MAKKQSTLASRLNRTITRNLWAPSGDPDEDNLLAATDAYKELKAKGLPIKSEQEVVNTLRRDNVYDSDFLRDMPGAPPMTEEDDA